MKIASAIAVLVLLALFVFPQALGAQESRKYEPLSGAEKRALQEAEPAVAIHAGAAQKKYGGFTKAELRELVKRDCPALHELSAGVDLHGWHWTVIGIGLALGTLLLFWPILTILAII